MTRALLATLYGFQNTGIRLLSAVLRQAGFDASIVYFKRWANNDVWPPTDREYGLFEKQVADLAPDLIGIGFGTPYLAIARKLTEKLRAVSSAHIVWGGVHPTLSPEDGIDVADSVCIGEGEYPLLDLMQAISTDKPIDEIKNLWVRAGDEVKKNPLRPLIQNLDELPFDKTFEGPLAQIEQNRLSADDPMKENAICRVFASRGCPYHCAYCYNNQYREIYKGLGKYHRIRSVRSVLSEIESSKKALPKLARVRFDDDTFLFPGEWIDEFCRDYPIRVGLPFDILLNPNNSKESQLRQLKRAGLVHVQVGIQGATEKELQQSYDRAGSNEQVLEMAKTLRGLAIEATYDVILDNPLAAEKDKRATLDLLLSMPRPFNLFLYSLTVFPKSDLARQLLQAGKIREEDIEGRATKSFRQFRLSLDYPRPAEDVFYASLITLTSKSFVPKGLIRWLLRSARLKQHPAPLRFLAEAANYVKLAQVAWRMLMRGELSVFKIREYGSIRRRLIQ